MSRSKKVEEEIINEEEGTPAIFLRKVDVIIQNEDEEPIIIKNTEDTKVTEDV